MDNYITGKLIKKLRENKKMTQQELAEKICVSDKAVSKWKTGKGLADISLIESLAKALDVSVIELMKGEYIINNNKHANMLKTNFYVCPICGNIIHSIGESIIYCCGITLPKQEAETYLDTIIKGIKGFFKIYEPNYNAKDKKITADYPLYDSLIGKLEGIEFIEEYLKSLKIENEYLSKYDTFKINELLYNYREDYTSLIENIFKIVLRQNIGQILAGEEVDTPNISHDGVSKIFLELNNMTKNEIYDKIKEAICRLEIKSKEAKEYIEKGLEELQFDIYNSYKLNNLDKVFICF